MMSNAKILRLSNEIYSERAIKETIRSFSKLAEIKYSKSENYFICEFKKCVYDTQLTMDEFSNYLIDLMNTKGFS